MQSSRFVTVRIDLAQVRENVRQIAALTRVPILAVIKADAYGTGAQRIVAAIADLVEGFCTFTLEEAAEARIWEQTGRPSIILGPSPGATVSDFIACHARPAVWDVQRAAELRAARPLLAVDTGMQRFGCPRDQIDAVIAAGGCEEAFTHAINPNQVALFQQLVGKRGMKLHAAGSSLLDKPEARFDAVRPGLALYRGAVRVSAPLIDVRETSGPAGYSGFTASHHGVILAGYSHGLRAGPCIINGRRSRIIEVGMQSAFVEAAGTDRVGDAVVLLGDALSEQDVAGEWKTSPHEVLTRMCGMGMLVNQTTYSIGD